MLNKLRQTAGKFWRAKKQGELKPTNDIQRENLDDTASLENDTSFRFSSVIGHLKKNWSEFTSLNKKFD
jgi:hypothetical protein